MFGSPVCPEGDLLGDGGQAKYRSDKDRPGYFDYAKARQKYTGTEWEDLLGFDAIKFQRDGFLEEAMVKNILANASSEAVDPAESPINHPGMWEFFQSHHQALGGDQMKSLAQLFKDAQKTTWYDHLMLDMSERAMQEGVEHCQNFVLLLSAENAAKCEVKLAADIKMIPAGSPERQEFEKELNSWQPWRSLRWCNSRSSLPLAQTLPHWMSGCRRTCLSSTRCR